MCKFNAFLRRNGSFFPSKTMRCEAKVLKNYSKKKSLGTSYHSHISLFYRTRPPTNSPDHAILHRDVWVFLLIYVLHCTATKITKLKIYSGTVCILNNTLLLPRFKKMADIQAPALSSPNELMVLILFLAKIKLLIIFKN